MDPESPTPNPAERRDSREQVIQTFNEAFSILEDKPDEELSPYWIWVKKSIQDARSKTLDQGRSAYENSFQDLETGEWYTQGEGIPVEELLNYLMDEADDLPEGPEKQRLTNMAHLLYRNCNRYVDDPGRMEPAKFKARIEQEAKLISQDARKQANMDEDWYLAERTMMGRLELILPPEAPEQVEPIQPEGPEPQPPVWPPQTPPYPIRPLPPITPPIQPPPIPITPPTPGQPEPEHPFDPDYRIKVINAQESASKQANLEAEERINELMREGSWWHIWRWPQRIGLRWVKSAAMQDIRERYLRVKQQSNTSYMNMRSVETAAAQFNAKFAGYREQGTTVRRFRTGNLAEGEEMEEVNGPLRTTIVEQILRPITEGRITNKDQVRQVLAQFVQNNLNDPDVRNFFGAEANDFGDVAQVFATDILETGKRIRLDMQRHNRTLQDLDQAIHIFLGNARMGHMGETRDWVDRTVAWAKRRQSENLVEGTRILGGLPGMIFNPYVGGAAASLATAELRMTGTIASRSAWLLGGPLAGALSGALVAFGRRWYELQTYDRPTHMAETAMGDKFMTQAQIQAEVNATPGWRGRLLRIPGIARAAGLYRRSDLEQYRYNVATAENLLNGGGVEDITDATRESVYNIIQTLRNNPADGAARDAAIRRVAEMWVRRDLSSLRRMDLIQFNNREQAPKERLELAKETVNLVNTLEAAGLTRTEIGNLTLPYINQWEAFINSDQTEKDRAFAWYRARNSLGQAAFGALAGLTFGLASREVAEAVGLSLPQGGGGVNAEQFRELYNNPRNIDVGSGLSLHVGPDHNAVFYDSQNRPIQTPGIKLGREGQLYINGTLDRLPQNLKDVIESWDRQPTFNPEYNLREGLLALIASGRHETFTSGNLIFDINSGPNRQLSIRMGDVVVHGFGRDDGSIAIDSKFGGNENLTSDQRKALINELDKNAWGIATAIETDKPFASAGEYLRSLGQLKQTMRELWHDNETPMRLVNGRWLDADGKELQFAHKVLPDGKIELDFSKMASQLRNGRWMNWDSTADNQFNRLVRDITQGSSPAFKNFEIMVTPTPSEDQQKLAVIFNQSNHPELARGILHLDPNSSEAKMFFNLDANGRPVLNQYGNFQRASYIEVAHMQPDGFRTVIATTQGTGEVAPPPPRTKEVLRLAPPNTIEFKPPNQERFTPSISIAETPRHPLGPPITPLEQDRLRTQERNQGQQDNGDNQEFINRLRARHNGRVEAANRNRT